MRENTVEKDIFFKTDNLLCEYEPCLKNFLHCVWWSSFYVRH